MGLVFQTKRGGGDLAVGKDVGANGCCAAEDLQLREGHLAGKGLSRLPSSPSTSKRSLPTRGGGGWPVDKSGRWTNGEGEGPCTLFPFKGGFYGHFF